MDRQIDIRYNAERHILRVAFNAEDCAQSANPPVDILERAKARFEKSMQQGMIDDYVLYEERLRSVWRALHDARDFNPQLKRDVLLIIGTGYPDMPGLEVKRSPDGKALALLSFHAPRAEIVKWRSEWVLLAIERKLSHLGVVGRPDPAQVRGELLRAREGKILRDIPLFSVEHVINSVSQKAAFNLLHNKARGEVVLIVNNLHKMKNLDMLRYRLDHMQDKLRQLNWRDKECYKLLKVDVVKAIGMAQKGHQGFGSELPVIILAAIRKRRPASEEATAAKRERLSEQHSLKPELVSFDITPDDMQASIAAVDPEVYNLPTFGDADLRLLCEKAGIIAGIDDAVLADAVSRIAVKDDVKGIIIATGRKAKGGVNPYLCVLGDGLEDTSVHHDLRAYNRQLTVKKGQLVAEMRFEESPIDGYTVRGQPTKVHNTGLTGVRYGEGIRRAEDGKYYAEAGGLFINDQTQGLYIKKALSHTGDVSLASGDIYFEGPVEISGDIDNGVRVFAAGDLVVKGEIRGGHVECNGNITVERGIVLGPTGSVRAKGDIRADFIENAHVTCGGSLHVKKSILSSRIMVAKDIDIENSTGVAVGGSLIFGGSFKTAKLGLEEGAKTEISGGVNFKKELSLAHRRKRLTSINEKAAQERFYLKELTKKQPHRLTRADKERKALLTARIPKWRKLAEIGQSLIQLATAEVYETTTDAKLYVSGELSQNCIVKMAGQTIPLDRPREGVVISAKPGPDGSRIQSYVSSSARKPSIKKAG